jgi:hypothetical protein
MIEIHNDFYSFSSANKAPAAQSTGLAHGKFPVRRLRQS